MNRYKNKFFSIMGDSISTLEGCIPDGYNVYYSLDNFLQTGVITDKATWWGQVINFFCGKILVNNSWSGSRVTKLPSSSSEFPSGCSRERTCNLHAEDRYPDVIMIYLGTNDYGYGVPIYSKNKSGNEKEYFYPAYLKMIRSIKNNYPLAEIWCFTIGRTFIKNHPEFSFPKSANGKNVEEYNKVIRELASDQGCVLIDLYKCKYESIDGTHPNAYGMKTISEYVIRSINRKKYSLLKRILHKNYI